MPWNKFLQNRNVLKKQYDEDHWIEKSGMTLDELGKACLNLLEKKKDLPRISIKADLFDFILHNAQLEINPHDFFVDKINHGNILQNIRNEWLHEVKKNNLYGLIEKNEAPGSWKNAKEAMQNHPMLTVEAITNNKRAKDADRAADEQKQAIAGRGFNGNTDFSHAIPSWEDIFQFGLSGLLKRIREERKSKENEGLLCDRQRIFYEACEKVYLALIDLEKRYSDEAEAIYLATGNEKMKLVSKTCKNLSKREPRSLIEALQLSILYYTVLTFIEGVGIRSLGYIDRLFEKYYFSDLESGEYSQEQLKELIQHYYYKFYSMKVLANTPFTLSGVDREGKTFYSEFSSILLEIYGELDIHDPKIQIRYNSDLPDDFLKKALGMIKKGNSSIVFMNDPIIIDGLNKIGISIEDARNYVPVGCYEPAAMGTEVPCSCNGRINLPKAIELVFNQGIDTLNGDALTKKYDEPKSWDEFYADVLEVVNNFIQRSMTLTNAYERYYDVVNPSPVFSATFEACIRNGVDAYEGGAKYNNSSINIFGIAEAVDSLMVVKKAVFEEKIITFSEFADILKNNWKNQEAFRMKCKNKYPKYGNCDREADELAANLVDDVSKMINLKPNGRGGVYRCGAFSIDACEYFGRITGALPDGRMAGEMLSKNMCAVVGADKKGVTGLVQSVTKIDFTKIPNGTVLDVVFHETAVRGNEGLDAMLGILKTYMEEGGLAIHFNVLDPTILRKAQITPEKYQSLQIRLCGWNVYFVNLNKEEQESFIRRTEHSSIA